MYVKTTRAVRIGGVTFKRGADLSSVSAAQIGHLRSRSLAVEGDVKDSVVDLGKMTVDQLKAFADEKQIDLGDATKKADIVAAIQLAIEAPAA